MTGEIFERKAKRQRCIDNNHNLNTEKIEQQQLDIDQDQESDDSWSFQIVSYNDNGKDINYDIQTLRIENTKPIKPKKEDDQKQESKEQEEEDVEMNNDESDMSTKLDNTYKYDENRLSSLTEIDLKEIEQDDKTLTILLEQNLDNFPFVRGSLLKMQTEIDVKTMMLETDSSPFIDANFRSTAKNLYSTMNKLCTILITFCQQLIRHKCIPNCMDEFTQQQQQIEQQEEERQDDENDDDVLMTEINPEIVKEMIYKLQNVYKEWIIIRKMYIEWTKQWLEITKRKEKIRAENEDLENKRKLDKDYLIATSRSNVYLINTQNMKIVDKIEDVMNTVLPGYDGCHRLEYIEYIPEICLLLVGSYASNRVVFIRIVNKYGCESEPVMIIEGYYPKDRTFEENLGCIYGIQVIKCSDKLWRLYVLHEINDRNARNNGVAVKIVSYLIRNDKVMNEKSNECDDDNNYELLNCLM